MQSFNPVLAQRHTRSPKHQFAVESRHWEIQPVLLAPVLPGETLNGLTIQSRVVTPPLNSRVVGSWLEYYIFYVPFRLMPSAANLVAMFIDPSTGLSATAAAPSNYYNGTGFNFITECLQVVTQEWFRREGEVWSSFVIRANRPAASVGMDNFLQSLIDATVLPTGGATASLTNLDDLERARIVLNYRRELAMMGADGGAIDYEEILAAYGASLRAAKKRERPELIRYIRDWTYPSNTVDPATGVPTTACSWAIADRADKNRAFNEPGFIFGVQVVRPKVYFTRQTSFASAMLNIAQMWLPPVMEGEGLERSLREFGPTAGPLAQASGGFTNNYWLDVRDLYNYGDQYLDATAAEVNGIALPAAGAIDGDGSGRYATDAMGNDLLTTAAADALIVSDGTVQLRIKTRHVDPS